MKTESDKKEKPHTLSSVNKSLCWLLAVIMIVMFISYYITVLAEVKLTKLGSETMRIRNENVELQNKLDNMMSYNKVEELVKRTNQLDTAKQTLEIDYIAPQPIKKQKHKSNIKTYYRWSLGF